jgi:hypothetical protein
MIVRDCKLCMIIVDFSYLMIYVYSWNFLLIFLNIIIYFLFFNYWERKIQNKNGGIRVRNQNDVLISTLFF